MKDSRSIFITATADELSRALRLVLVARPVDSKESPLPVSLTLSVSDGLATTAFLTTYVYFPNVAPLPSPPSPPPTLTATPLTAFAVQGSAAEPVTAKPGVFTLSTSAGPTSLAGEAYRVGDFRVESIGSADVLTLRLETSLVNCLVSLTMSSTDTGTSPTVALSPNCCSQCLLSGTAVDLTKALSSLWVHPSADYVGEVTTVVSIDVEKSRSLSNADGRVVGMLPNVTVVHFVLARPAVPVVSLTSYGSGTQVTGEEIRQGEEFVCSEEVCQLTLSLKANESVSCPMSFFAVKVTLSVTQTIYCYHISYHLILLLLPQFLLFLALKLIVGAPTDSLVSAIFDSPLVYNKNTTYSVGGKESETVWSYSVRRFEGKGEAEPGVLDITVPFSLTITQSASLPTDVPTDVTLQPEVSFHEICRPAVSPASSPVLNTLLRFRPPIPAIGLAFLPPFPTCYEDSPCILAGLSLTLLPNRDTGAYTFAATASVGTFSVPTSYQLGWSTWESVGLRRHLSTPLLSQQQQMRFDFSNETAIFALWNATRLLPPLDFSGLVGLSVTVSVGDAGEGALVETTSPTFPSNASITGEILVEPRDDPPHVSGVSEEVEVGQDEVRMHCCVGYRVPGQLLCYKCIYRLIFLYALLDNDKLYDLIDITSCLKVGYVWFEHVF